MFWFRNTRIKFLLCTLNEQDKFRAQQRGAWKKFYNLGACSKLISVDNKGCYQWGTYCNLPSAGPALRTSDIAMEGSPLAKCGLSLPPLTAIPKPNPGTCHKRKTVKPLRASISW